MDQHRADKLNQLKGMDVQPYVNSFKAPFSIKEISGRFGKMTKPELEEKKYTFTLAGRITAARKFGKASFLNIKDRTGNIQIYVRKGDVSDEEFDIFKLTDIGDFIGVSGYVFKTKTGELSIYAEKFSLLTKSLRDLPEKWHGLKDVETRYRQRYVDLIVNSDVQNIFKKRSRIIQEIRNYFTSMDFMEVETPMMQPIAGGATAKPFVTHHNALDMPLFMRIAPELYLKRLVIGGFERVFEINRNFRNEGLSTRHNPEFTMIEWYWAYADYNDLMDMIEEFLRNIALKVCADSKITYGENEIDFASPWKRMTISEAILEMTDLSDDDIADRESAAKTAESKGIHIKDGWGHGKVVMEIFEELVEDKLIDPTFITDYPKEVSPLSKSKADNPDITERFELFIAGYEIANGFNELNDPMDQKERFEKQVLEKEAGDEEAHMMDSDYIRALEYGLPPTAGAGLGIDRLVMILTDSPSIRDVILFPHMRPEAGESQQTEE
ncbi:lysine--tRNA ligase [Limisalsivibrio acetivorans]|uniref:lysine--tRNA ligase n=1 Tax=Limisalsivibrio acetivorans TaxID=1304888 RepID=UPI0003B3E267|nr:lysine--tRNA ligase [Limisalsivibrio acetivorans]